MLDLKIINGEIIDGSDSARYRGNIGISGQDIVAMGKVRGLLKTGWRADTVVFDPDQVGCGSSYIRNDLPGNEGRLYAEATGISHAVVNGQTIVSDGIHAGATPGTVYRSGCDTRTVGLAG